MGAFIDLGDKGRYKYNVSAPVGSGNAEGVWSISLQEVVVERIEGLEPYFSTSRESFFDVGRK